MHKYTYNVCMTCIIRTVNLKFYVYGDDHNPPHVHVRGPSGAEAVIEIKTQKIKESKGFTQRALKLIQNQVLVNREELLEEWSRHNG